MQRKKIYPSCLDRRRTQYMRENEQPQRWGVIGIVQTEQDTHGNGIFSTR